MKRKPVKNTIFLKTARFHLEEFHQRPSSPFSGSDWISGDMSELKFMKLLRWSLCPDIKLGIWKETPWASAQQRNWTGWTCSGCRCLSTRAVWHWKRCWLSEIAVLKFILLLFVRIIQRLQVSVARYFQNRTSLDAGGCQLFNSCFNFPALWLGKVFEDSSSVSLMIDFIIWLFLLTPIGYRLYQTSPRRGKVDRLCRVRQDDAKGTRWRLKRGTYHLQLQNIFGRKLRGFFRQSRRACFSRILDVQCTPCCFRPSRNGHVKTQTMQTTDRPDCADW